MTESRRKNVIYLGPQGTYTHQAALQQFDDHDQFDLIPAKSIPECLDELENNPCIHYAVIPLENSTNGQVVFSYDLLRDRMLKSLNPDTSSNRVIPPLQIIAEQYVSIEHCLISREHLTMSELGKYKIIRVYSHPQVWGQVNQYLKELQQEYPNTTFEKLDTSSTSEAVIKVMDSKTNEHENVLNLAIASEFAAKLNKVNVLQRGINDQLGNTTRFMVFKKRKEQSPAMKCAGSKVNLLTFTTKQDDPGALVDVLTVLKDYSVNMCSINTRPFNTVTLERKWQYVFFLEYYENNENIDWTKFYQQFGSYCLEWCLWGTFYRDPRYYN
ncbi:hypothetical protein HG535_0F01990 [Zygotorulaspora mrakii]|uniref:prephenate dehydratase n=1 Tax=Zygotorulaspora mrakii TaxID=42260 RepID=A0A7H9B4S2_ZYGMR|nr:uncharacterized protein HG535_0F01990 [Zygotorulaspora mrakii]QLG73688.1 hypothetical protein HG535_0F01990 [Zygotorulaspora mrakii]